jgi:hypothetical protein
MGALTPDEAGLSARRVVYRVPPSLALGDNPIKATHLYNRLGFVQQAGIAGIHTLHIWYLSSIVLFIDGGSKSQGGIQAVLCILKQQLPQCTPS